MHANDRRESLSKYIQTVKINNNVFYPDALKLWKNRTTITGKSLAYTIR